MIEKLKPVPNTDFDYSAKEWPPGNWAIMHKINEIIDDLNRREKEEKENG